MKEGTISEAALKEFQETKVIFKRRMTKLCKGDSRYTHGVIASLVKKGHNIETIKHNDGLFINKYIYKGYKKPFYLIARDIELKHPKIEALVRKLYNIAN